MTMLNARTLADVSRAVPVPGYDRSQVRTGIVHFGVGGFHRAHQAMYVARMTDPATRIVSLTITEGGYHVNQVTGLFDPDNPGIQHDLGAGAVPESAFGLVVEGLARRRAAGVPAYTVMSCDNIPGNGDVARRMLTSYARMT